VIAARFDISLSKSAPILTAAFAAIPAADATAKNAFLAVETPLEKPLSTREITPYNVKMFIDNPSLRKNEIQ